MAYYELPSIFRCLHFSLSLIKFIQCYLKVFVLLILWKVPIMHGVRVRMDGVIEVNKKRFTEIL